MCFLLLGPYVCQGLAALWTQNIRESLGLITTLRVILFRLRDYRIFINVHV